jgi:hypothetical protein
VASVMCRDGQLGPDQWGAPQPLRRPWPMDHLGQDSPPSAAAARLTSGAPGSEQRHDLSGRRQRRDSHRQPHCGRVSPRRVLPLVSWRPEPRDDQVVGNTRRQFDPEFRAGAVRIATETDKPVVGHIPDFFINLGDNNPNAVGIPGLLTRPSTSRHQAVL